MPTIPNISKLTASSVDIFNAIRNSATANYRDYVPLANASQDNIREIGAIIMQFPALQNEFLTALVNRIGLTLIKSKSFANPWRFFKKGVLDYGETIEEIFVNIAKPFTYDAETATTNVFKREIPDVRAAFHPLNYKKFYKTTVQQNDLRQAFLSWNGISDLIAKIVESLYNGMEYDEFLVMKYLLARNILNGRLYPVTIANPNTEANIKSDVATIKGVSNNLPFMNSKYNVAGVQTFTPKDEQYIITTANFDALMDVEVLASAFNMDKADFIGRRVMIDEFGNLDNDRLSLLFSDDPNYTELTAAEEAKLATVNAVLIDRDFFMIFDNLFNMTDLYNGEGLYWNYWLHVWKTFSVSPFSNAIVFVTGAGAVTGVSISPSAVTTTPGQTIQLNATVETTGIVSKAVIWTTNDTSGKVYVDPLGNVVIAEDFEGDSITVTATSAVNSAQSATATITIA